MNLLRIQKKTKKTSDAHILLCNLTEKIDLRI